MVTLPDITQGQMIRNTAQTLIMQAAARSTPGGYPGKHLRGTLGLSTRGPIRSGHGGLHNTRHHDCQAQLLGQILPLDTWILGYLDTWMVCLHQPRSHQTGTQAKNLLDQQQARLLAGNQSAVSNQAPRGVLRRIAASL